MRIFISLTIALTAALAFGQATELPAGGKSIISEGGIKAFRLAGDATKAEVNIVQVVGQPFAQALQLRTKERPENVYNLQAQARNVLSLKKNDVCMMTFAARATETSDEMAEATLGVVFEHAGAPHTKSLDRTLKLSSEWRRFYLPFVMAQDEQQANCNLRIGYMPQTIEIADFQLLTYGTAVQLSDLPMKGSEVRYAGREPDAPWRKQAAARIEQHRKAPITVRVTDAAGRPVAGAQVKIEMQRHAYHFGAAVTAKMLTEDTAEAKRYQQIVLDNFNAVVLENDLKFGPWTNGKTSPRTASYNNQNTLEALKWLKANGIYVRGHCLLWGPLDKRFYTTANGFDFDSANVAPNRAIIDAYVTDILTATDGLIGEWDVVNHPIATWGDKSRCWSDLFGREFYAEMFVRARKANPNMRLFINEGGDIPGDSEQSRKKYEDIIAWLQEQKAPVDGIGFMAHFGAASLSPPTYIYQHLERYAKFGLPMRATELDVSTDGDEQVQADYYRDFMTMFFSHPQTDGIIMWGFWEGRHWHPDRALWRKNWELKPSGQAWLDLVKKQWWTDEQGSTATDGTLATSGFLGEYQVSVKSGDKTHELTLVLAKGGAECVVVLK